MEISFPLDLRQGSWNSAVSRQPDCSEEAPTGLKMVRSSAASSTGARKQLPFGGDDRKTLYFTNYYFLGAVNVKISVLSIPTPKSDSEKVVVGGSTAKTSATGTATHTRNREDGAPGQWMPLAARVHSSCCCRNCLLGQELTFRAPRRGCNFSPKTIRPKQQRLGNQKDNGDEIHAWLLLRRVRGADRGSRVGEGL